MHPESRPHRLLMGDPAALHADRMVLAAARKYRGVEAALDVRKPGELGIDAIIKLLVRRNVQGG